MRFSLLTSSLIHALLIGILLLSPGGEGQGEGKYPPSEYADVEIVPPPVEEEVRVEDGELEKLKKRAPHAGDKCDRFYGGIGVVEGSLGIVEVYPGYPAHKAGILAGDEVDSTEEIRGEVGTPVTVVIRRDGRRIEFHLIRDKICYNRP